MTAVGIDACAKGWVAAAITDDGGVNIEYLKTIESVATAIPAAAGIAIDIPIGFPTTHYREADLAARALLGARRNSLFLTPPRAVLEAATHAEATELSVQLTGKGVSQQSYALRSKIFEVAQWLPRAPCPVWEVHPEVSFAVLIGRPAASSKKSWAGMTERRDALAAAGISLERVAASVGRLAAVDDVVDAAVAAWTALRLLNKTAISLPEESQVDADGRGMAIWA